MKSTPFKEGTFYFTKDGKISRLNTDTSVEPENFDRVCNEEESPAFSFDLRFGQDGSTNLNKQNFFNPLMKKCPAAVQSFCNWIDEYKEHNNWNKLFNSDSNWQDAAGKNAPAPKFHDLPWAMQFGILMDFLSFKIGHCGFMLTGDWQEPESLAQKIADDFGWLEMEIRNGDNQI